MEARPAYRADAASAFKYVAGLQDRVRQFGACSLPGVSIVFDRFMAIMQRAVSKGFVRARRRRRQHRERRHRRRRRVGVRRLSW